MKFFLPAYRSSLANRLTTWYGLSAFILIFATAYFPYWSMVRALQVESSKLLFDKLQTIRLISQNSDQSVAALKNRIENEWGAKKIEKIYVKIVDSHGRLVAATPDLEPNILNLLNQLANSTKYGRVDSINQDSAGVYRVLVDKITIHENFYLVYLILDRSEQAVVVRRFRKTLYLALSLSLILSLLIGRRIATQGMKPLVQIAVQAGHIRSTNLNERIDLKRLPIELSNLAKTFNEMLNRLEYAFARLSQFSADLAHELRTPVNNMAGQIEVTLGKKNRSEEHYRDVLGSCLEENARISRVIDSLLFLARCEDPAHNVPRETVNLKKELETVLEFYEASIAEAGIETKVEVPENFYIKVERTLFQRAIGNLLSNALKQTAPSGKITVAARQEIFEVVVQIADNGQGIAAHHLPHIFERFYRVDPSRSKHSGGTGLGLAIVKSIALLHGGSVAIASELGKGTQVSLRFPSIIAT